MTPKEKAQELFNKYCFAIRTEQTDSGYWTNVIYAKDCALIAVDMVIECCRQYDELNETFVTQINHWQEVKQEIEKL
jgi:hypothetical protein